MTYSSKNEETSVEEANNVKFCVTAFLDLQGISSHLEVGSDLRTNIGSQVVKRLNVLNKVINLINAERKKFKECYPTDFKYYRINDSLILCIDLPETFKPETGENLKSIYTFDDIQRFMESKNRVDGTTETQFMDDWNSELKNISLFIGLIARIHLYVNGCESSNYFPGAKTIISTGFRRQFFVGKDEDILSANFSFSNAYIAEKSLKGSKIYIDEYLLSLLALAKPNHNIIKHCLLKYTLKPYDFFKEHTPFPNRGHEQEETQSFELEIFRKKYLFREVNANSLSCLQLFDYFSPYIMNNKLLIEKTKPNIFHELIKELKMEYKNIDEVKKASTYIFRGLFDLSQSLEYFINKNYKDEEKLLHWMLKPSTK